MRHAKKTTGRVFFVLVLMSSLLATSCDDSSSPVFPPEPTPVLEEPVSPALTLHMTPATAEIGIGREVSFTVTTRNTDFMLAAPELAGCLTHDKLITCRPTALGTYTLEVKATADLTKTATAVLTVHPPAYKLHGLNFSPYIQGQFPGSLVIPLSQLRERMRIVAPYTEWVRAFGSTHGIENTCRVAREYGLKCLGSAWLSADLNANDEELSGLIQAGKDGLLDGAIIGNEVLMRQSLTEAQLVAYMERVRADLPGVPISYGDDYSTLRANPNVLAACDFIFLNYYPYWDGRHIGDAVAHLHAQYQKMLQEAAGKKVLISETGWPSGGNAVGEAVPSPENARFYFLNFVSWARANHVQYFYFSAFDEAWKAAHEGPQGAHWGRWDAHGNMKAGSREVFDGLTLDDNWSCMAAPGGPGTPAIQFTSVPPMGSSNHLQGQVWHAMPADHRIVVYIQVDGNWWIKPYNDERKLTPIRCNGTFSVNISTGGNDGNATRIVAYLIPATYEPPVLLNMAVLEANSVAWLQVSR